MNPEEIDQDLFAEYQLAAEQEQYESLNGAPCIVPVCQGHVKNGVCELCGIGEPDESSNNRSNVKK